MKRKLLLLSAAAILLAFTTGSGGALFFRFRPEGKFTPAVSAAVASPALEVRVLSWNILQSHNTLLGAPWAKRKLSFQSVFEASRFDIICLQEALPEQIAFFSSILPGYGLYAVGRDDGKSAGEHCPIFFNTARYRLRDSGTFWLSRTPEKPSESWGEGVPRLCSWVELEDKSAGERFRVYNLHLHLNPYAQPRAAKVMEAKLKGLRVPSIVVGDFNAPHGWPAMKVLTRAGFTEADTASALTYHIGGKGVRCLDHILTDARWQVVSGGVLKDKGGDVFPSDHFGLWARLALR